MVSLREADEFIDHCENERPQNLEGQEYECKEKWSIYKWHVINIDYSFIGSLLTLAPGLSILSSQELWVTTSRARLTDQRDPCGCFACPSSLSEDFWRCRDASDPPKGVVERVINFKNYNLIYNSWKMSKRDWREPQSFIRISYQKSGAANNKQNSKFLLLSWEEPSNPTVTLLFFLKSKNKRDFGKRKKLKTLGNHPGNLQPYHTSEPQELL